MFLGRFPNVPDSMRVESATDGILRLILWRWCNKLAVLYLILSSGSYLREQNSIFNQQPWTAILSVGAVAGHCSDSPWAPSCVADMSH